MKILAFKPGHDGCVALVDNGELIFSIEEEKDSGIRYASLSPINIVDALAYVDGLPDVVAVSGWDDSRKGHSQSGYFGVDSLASRDLRVFGRPLKHFSSSHERSHLLCAYGLSPFEQGRPCYALVMEGCFGSFYKFDRNLKITKYETVMFGPGWRYNYIYCLGAGPGLDRGAPETVQVYAGKLMALAGCAPAQREPDEEAKRAIDFLIDTRAESFGDLVRLLPLYDDRPDPSASPFYNIGIETPKFTAFARRFQDAIFDRFHRFAKINLTENLPLVIAGGCGLNCDWNTKWRNSALFPDVFVPPCPNDSGSAIGTAIDAQFHFTGKAKITWSVYAGEEFVSDVGEVTGFDVFDLDYDRVAEFLGGGKVIGWVQDRYEIGPRALGNRSLLAAPFDEAMRRRLNAIKQREDYRPIAPVCLEADVEEHFEWQGSSEHMLYFQNVRTRKLRAVTHADATARVQTVNEAQNKKMYRLLQAFKRHTGYGVLCNTSLNFSGRGFINRLSEMIRFARERELDGMVVGDKFYVRR